MANLQSPWDYIGSLDPSLTSKLVTHIKSHGIFDQFRRECMADVDTKPAYLNLRQRVEGCVAAFLRKNPWRPDMNKNQMRDNLRKHIQSGGFLDMGVDRIVDQVVNPKIYTVFLPKVEEIVNSCVKIEEGKPKFVLPTKPEPMPEEINFQNKHNLAPRSKLPAPLTGPMRPTLPSIETLKKEEPVEKKSENFGSPNTEDSSNENYMVDEEDTEGNAEDDEESPPFEPNSETDRLILGVRTDSSDSNSNDDQVVTTIVDDNLEEIIDNGDAVADENDENKEEEEESSSDEYVPKTPTINVEGSDGSLIELNTISEYKQYQTKFDEESFGNVVEEIVSSQWADENGESLKEEKESGETSQKRKLNLGSFDDGSNSSIDKGDTSDDGKIATFGCIMKEKIKREDVEDVDDDESGNMSEFVVNESYDSNTDRSMDVPDAAPIKSEYDLQEHHKISSTKELEKSNFHNRSLTPERHSTHSSKDKNYERHESSTDRKKDKERKKSQSHSHSHSEKEDHKHKSKESGKRRSHKSESHTKEINEPLKDMKQSKHEYRDQSKDIHKHKKHSYNHPEGKKHSDATHRHDRDRKHSSHSSRHTHSSSKHSHKSSSEKHKSDKSLKHKDSTEKVKSHNTNTAKDKHESRKKSRERCKSRDKEERRPSTDRDSNGPSGRSYLSSNSTISNRSTPSRNNAESSGTGDRTTSNSDNTVSENIETQPCDDIYMSNEHNISSPDFESHNESENTSNEWNMSTEDDSGPKIEDFSFQSINEVQNIVVGSSNIVDITQSNNVATEKEELNVIQSEDTYNNIQSSKDPAFSPGKENRKDVNTDHSDSTATKEIKFKKPKIAANIFEVRKIMKKRRHMERKRIRLLTNNGNKAISPSKNLQLESSEKHNEENFIGFEEATSNKIIQYDCLIERLSKDMKTSDEDIQIKDTITTSWLDIDPSLDDYIKNVLKAKVYRKSKVILPPISDENYKFDDEQKAYVLLKLNNDSTKQNIVDSNLNNLTLKSQEISSATFDNDSENIKTSSDGEINYANNICDTSLESSSEDLIVKTRKNGLETLQNTRNCKQAQKEINLSADECIPTTNNLKSKEPLDEKLVKGVDISVPKPVFSLTFNQTYDEILKERQQRVLIKTPCTEKNSNTSRTVVKITNDQISEQVVVKTVNSNSLHSKVPVPRITRNGSVVNGEIPKTEIQKRQIPLISRVIKTKNNALKSQTLNGSVSPDSTTNLEVKIEESLSQKLINDIIGIQHTAHYQGEISDNSSQSGDDMSEKTHRRHGTRQQRYDSSDLYKPRPQLSTRRGRGRHSEVISPVPAVFGQKRTAVMSDAHTPRKRKR